MPKILHILHGLHAGGMENGIINLAHGMHSMGFQHDICSLTDLGEFSKRVPHTSQLYALEKREGFDWKCLKKLRHIIAKSQPDIIHTHNYGALLYGGIASKIGLSRVPVLAGEHSQLRADEIQPHKKRIRKILYRHFADQVHTVSEGQRQELLTAQLVNAQRCLSIANGVNVQRFQPQNAIVTRTAQQLPADALIIGMVARFAPTKRHMLLLEALTLLESRLPNLHLVLVGDRGAAKPQIMQALETHSVKSRIHWLGERADLPNIYPALDALILPSENEGMSNVCLEAMACGIPALVHDACGSSEIIIHEQTGLIASMPDAQAVANTILRFEALKHQHWQKNCREHILQHFSIERMLFNYATCYQQLLTSR